jgi:hypothetical protein
MTFMSRSHLLFRLIVLDNHLETLSQCQRHACQSELDRLFFSHSCSQRKSDNDEDKSDENENDESENDESENNEDSKMIQ